MEPPLTQAREAERRELGGGLGMSQQLGLTSVSYRHQPSFPSWDEHRCLGGCEQL